MPIPTKSLKSGFTLPVYGLGLWYVGGSWFADHSKDDQELEAIDYAIKAGITHVDTAEVYGEGHAEELLGQVLPHHDRKKLFIATKVSGQHQTYDGVMRAFEGSLKRLGTDYIDLYILHRFPPPGIDIKETMRAMNELVDQGVVKNIGVSNFTVNRVEAAQTASKHKITSNQVHYNVQYREVEERGLLKHAQENYYFIVAWRPVQKGMLPESDLVRELAEKYDKSPIQIAINWLISQDNVVTLSKTSNIEHLKENLGAVGWTMDTEDIEQLRREFPHQQTVADVPLDYPGDVAP